MNLTITYDAGEDIRSIFDYAISEFDLNQAEKYYHGLQVIFSLIVEGRAHIQDYSFVRHRTNGNSRQSTYFAIMLNYLDTQNGV